MTQKELEEVLRLHKLWLVGKPKGKRANLSNTDLSNLDLSNIDLSNANLNYANLCNANLSNSNLRNSNLSDTNLYNANLYNTDLSNADFYNTNFHKAKNCYIFTAYDTSKRIVYCVKHDDTWMVQAGCFWGTLDELEVRVRKTHNSKVYLANVELLRGLE